MIMKIEQLASKRANSIPGYKLVYYFEAGFPIYKVLLNITIQKHKQLSLAQEFCLRLLDIEITEIENIAGCLGIDSGLVENIVVELCTKELIRIDLSVLPAKITLNEKGKMCLHDMAMILPENVSYEVLYDALTGKITNNDENLYNSKVVETYGLHTVHAYIPKPTINDINYNDISRLFKIQQADSSRGVLDGNLLSINDIEKKYIEYRKMNVLVFVNEDNISEIDFEVYERSQKATEYEGILIKMENEGIRVIPTTEIINIKGDSSNLISSLVPNEIKESAYGLSQDVQSLLKRKAELEERRREMEVFAKIESGDLSASQRIDELNGDLEDLESQIKPENKILNTYDHRPLLEDTLRDAKKLVVIINDDSFDYNLEILIDSALKRKVNIVIGFEVNSMQKENRRQLNAIKRLREIQKRGHGKRLHVVEVSNTHEKILIADRKYIVITSFTWLSFRGDLNRGFRQETGLYTESTDVINDALVQLELNMNMELNRLLT